MSRITSKKRTLLITACAVAVLVIVFAVLEARGITNFISSPTPTSGPSEQQKEDAAKADSDAKKDFIETKDPTPTPTTTTDSSISLTANQEGQSVVVLTQLKGYPSGSCELLVQNGSASFSQTADIIYQPEFSSCAGFTIPVSKLGVGQWKFTLTAKQADGTAAEKSIELGVK